MVNRSLPAVGEQVSDFTVLRVVGEGATGVVYEARAASGESVAVKVLKPEAAEDPEVARAFADEGRATGAVEHENVVTILGQGEENGRAFIVMEYVDGPSLERLIQAKKHLPWKLAVRLIRPVVRALGHAHDSGLIHRDVKPGNVLLYRDGRPRLTDFGIVKDIGSLKGYLVQGRAVGTPSYASPEQCLGKRLSGATDMYSLGATLYHALTGRPPFTGDTAVKIAQKHAQIPPMPPIDRVPDIPRALSKLVEKMLAKKVVDRVESMARLDHDLGMILEGKVAIAVGAPQPKVNRAALKGLRRTRASRRTG